MSCRRGRTIVDELSFDTKVPTFGKSLFPKVASSKLFPKTYKGIEKSRFIQVLEDIFGNDA